MFFAIGARHIDGPLTSYFFPPTWQPSWCRPDPQKPKSPIPGVTSKLVPIQASIRSSAPSHPRVPIPASIRLNIATGGARLCHGSHQDKGFHPALPLVFHPCHLFSRTRTRRTRRPGARVEGGVVICSLADIGLCCMYTLPPLAEPLCG